ncbi:zinc ABC transporter ATP-binding protein ZnuC [Azospirillum sp. RWY-5-1]|uniref:Zinc ABC transporter ATP-binding protein ZnuC n=1 Tax=Azospirillum oleiclasticum TaxID=2735135 RepID=A0ABX2TBA9_9PROT|nr:zinc ABC transporter ATP-binding protein ZnuC [Azospirillum oleiclasticum]NYZ13013.1 zinc ABC transporter ATP-binding protein ZnuC [Azospirillum oleiclasticum]NYZ20314.1 zinc ABC transporter ATP-binding protein ZnuC [Azospirillum oleiclasticum]
MSTHPSAPSPDRAPVLVQAIGLGVTLGGRPVLERVDLTVSAGEIVTLVGPNGAGKTTLVRAVLGLVRPTAGTVRRRPWLRVGYMPQKLAIDATLPLTVRRFLGLWRRVEPARIAAALEEVGVGRVADSPVQAISGGEMQRVLLARALLSDPELLVLDEPDQAVDVQGQAELFARIDAARRARGCGVLMVSHDLHTVMARTHRVVCINRHVCCSGTPEDVSRHPEFNALFGRFAAEVAVYTHRHDHAHAGDGHVVPLPDGHHHPEGHGEGCHHG